MPKHESMNQREYGISLQRINGSRDRDYREGISPIPVENLFQWQMFGKHDSPSKAGGSNLPYRTNNVIYSRAYRGSEMFNTMPPLNNYAKGLHQHNQSNNEPGQNMLASPSPKLNRLNPATLQSPCQDFNKEIFGLTKRGTHTVSPNVGDRSSRLEWYGSQGNLINQSPTRHRRSNDGQSPYKMGNLRSGAPFYDYNRIKLPMNGPDHLPPHY